GGGGEWVEWGEGGEVVEGGVRGCRDLRVARLEAKLFNAGFDLLCGVADARVDQNVPRRRRDEIRGQVVAADPVDVADHPEGRKGFRPVCVLRQAILRRDDRGGPQREHDRQT